MAIRVLGVMSLLTVAGALAGCGGNLDSNRHVTHVLSQPATSHAVVSVDVVVYGATPSGIAAAIEAARRGKQVLLLEPTRHVGGMTSNGLGRTDVYNMKALGGLVQTFFQTVHAIDGASVADDGLGTLYEPHVAEQAFLQMLAQQHTLRVVYNAALTSVTVNNHAITSVLSGNGVRYRAAMFIDSSYEGDLMAAAGVPYALGREAAQQYGESLAGIQTPTLPAGLHLDPYVVPGNAHSGLLSHIEPGTLGSNGAADDSLMSYNYRLCVSNDPNNRLPFAAPANYDPQEFEALARWIQAAVASGLPLSVDHFFTLRALPNHKFDLNNSSDPHAAVLSTDDVGANVGYVSADATARRGLATDHRRYMQGLLYFLTSDARVPQSIRNAVAGYGLCKDEFTDNDGWPRQLYVREARRMLGAYVLTQRDIEGKAIVADAIGLGGYNMDSHLTHRIAINDSIYAEGASYTAVDVPYPIPYRVLTPAAAQLGNLLVSVAVSASHVAYESLRVEPTLMIMGQAAGAAAAAAIDENVSVQNVSNAALQQQLLADGQVLDCCLWAKTRKWWRTVTGSVRREANRLL